MPCYDDNNVESMLFKLSAPSPNGAPGQNDEIHFRNNEECTIVAADPWYTLPGPLLGFEIEEHTSGGIWSIDPIYDILSGCDTVGFYPPSSANPITDMTYAIGDPAATQSLN